MFEFTNFEDTNGKHFRFSWKGGPSVHFIGHKRLLASETFGQTVSDLHHGVGLLGLVMNKHAETLNEQGLRARLAGDIKTTVAKPYKATVATARSRVAEIDRNRAEVRHQRKVDAGLATEIRAWLRYQKPADAVSAALADPDVAASALAQWRLAGLPDTLRGQVEDALIRANLIDQFTSRNSNSTRATASDPLAYGPDRAAAAAHADAALQSYAEWTGEVDLLRSTLRDLIGFTAAVADMRPDAALAMLSVEA